MCSVQSPVTFTKTRRLSNADMDQALSADIEVPIGENELAPNSNDTDADDDELLSLDNAFEEVLATIEDLKGPWPRAHGVSRDVSSQELEVDNQKTYSPKKENTSDVADIGWLSLESPLKQMCAEADELRGWRFHPK